MLTQKKWLAAFVAGLMLALLPSMAEAKTVAQALQEKFGQVPNNLSFEDDTQAVTVLDTAQSGTLDEGDRMRGHLRLRNIIRTQDSTAITLGGSDVTSDVNELTGYFEIEVVSKSGNETDGFVFEFGPWSSGGTIIPAAGSSEAFMAIFEDASQNGTFSGATIPDPTVVDGDVWAYMGLGGKGNTKFTVRTEEGPAGIHVDGTSAAGAPTNLLLGTGALRFNLIPQGGDVITDVEAGPYRFTENAFGTDFASSFDFFGAAGTGADFTAAIEFRTTLAIIPLPPAVLATLPAFGLLATGMYRRSRRRAA